MTYITGQAIGQIFDISSSFEQHQKYLIFPQVSQPYGSERNADEAIRTAILFREKKLHRKLM
jgi:hypothetical protein